MGSLQNTDATTGFLSVNGNVALTPEGGIAIRLINKTGAVSVKGTIVRCSTTTNNAFEVMPTVDFDSIGAVYESGIADGSLCWVVVGGIAEVLVQNGIAPARENWVGTSTTVAGRAWFGAVPVPPTDARHFQEIGHCLESKVASPDQLCKIVMHFN